MRTVDLNCDMGESFGAWRMGRDAELMRYVSSANIACGFHAGDASTIRRTIELTIEHGVAAGAHPGYPDLQGFGRRNIAMPPKEVHDIVFYQTAALKAMCEGLNTRLRHVKPHGALYNQAAIDRPLAEAIAAAVRRTDPELILYGLAGSCLIEQGVKAGLRTASEAFADRTYQKDGTLTPRSDPAAVVEDAAEAALRAVSIVRDGQVEAADASVIEVEADTICIHGDAKEALAFAASIRSALNNNGIGVRPIL